MRPFLFQLIFILLPAIGMGQNESKEIDSIGMNNLKLQELIKSEVKSVEGELGAWTLEYAEKMVFVITDEKANRMRIFSPVIPEEELEKGQLRKMLIANFHSALDAKYGLYEGFVVSIFTHPLKELTNEQFIDALQQIVILNYTFGTTYQSTDMVFPGGIEKEPSKVNEKPIKRS